MIGYSQQGEDEWISANVRLPENGFYVDIGCAHPVQTSNTAFLRDMGWKGLAIDGNPAWENDWKGIPGFICAVIAQESYVAFSESSWWSRIGGPESKERIAVTIEHLLGYLEIGKIDFLSIDTEGTEFHILSSFDFDLHSPDVVVAEYNAVHLPIVAPDVSPIPALMKSRGYSLRHVCEPANMIFTR